LEEVDVAPQRLAEAVLELAISRSVMFFAYVSTAISRSRSLSAAKARRNFVLASDAERLRCGPCCWIGPRRRRRNPPMGE
jgi:hypothetical protein